MARKILDSNVSFDDIDSRLGFTEVALQLAAEDGDKEVAGLATPITKILGRWEGLAADRRTQRRAESRANARCKRRNLQIDTQIKAVHNGVLSIVDQDRTDKLFKLLFPKSLSVLIKPQLEGQVKIAQAFAERFAKSEAPAALQKAHTAPLAASITAGEAALKERVAVTAAAAKLATQIETLRIDANAALQHVEGALQQLASKRRLGREFVDSFFPDSNKSRAAKKPAPPPAASSA